jgi:hypothetical protein
MRWRFEPGLDVRGKEYMERLSRINERMHTAGVDGCPTSCMAETDLRGCNQTHRCGVPYMKYL